MEIKEFSVADGVALQKIRLQSLCDSPKAFGSSYEDELAWEKSVYENRIRSGECTYFGAFVDGSAIGIVCLVFNMRLKTKHRATITSFYVDTNYRGQGIGKKLILSAIEKARLLKTVEQVELSVVTEQSVAISLYKSMGFEIYGEEAHSLKIDGRYYNQFYMMKKLH